MKQLNKQTMLEQLDQLANKLFAEFGFHSCDREQQELILIEFITNIKS